MKLAQLFQLMNLIDELINKKIVCFLDVDTGFNALSQQSFYVSSYVIVGASTLSLDPSTSESTDNYLNAIRNLLNNLDKAAANEKAI